MAETSVLNTHYWLRKFSQEPEFIDIGYLEPDKTGERQKVEVSVPDELRKIIVEVCDHSEVAILAYFVGALRLLIGRYLNLTDIPVFSYPSRRVPAPGQRLYFRCRLIPGRTIRDLLNEELKEIQAAFLHQEYDPLILARKAQLNYQIELAALPGIGFRWDTLQSGNDLEPAQLEVRLSEDAGGNWNLTFTFPAGIEAEFGIQLLRHYKTLLQKLHESMECPAMEVDMLTEREREAMVLQLKPQLVSRAKGKTLHQLFGENVGRYPGKAAICQGAEEISYSQLDALSDALAAVLQHQGVLEDDVVAQWMPAGFWLVIAQVAILKCGAVVLSMDTTTPMERVLMNLRDSKARLVLTMENAGWPSPCSVLNVTGLDLNGITSVPRRAVRTAEDPAYLFYTSGSTGKPKGVLLTHGNLIEQLSWLATYFGFDEGTVIPQKSSVNFIDSVFEIIHPITCGGATIYLRPYEGIVVEPAEIQGEWFRKIGVTWMILVPSVFEQLWPAISVLPTLQQVCIGGEELTAVREGAFRLFHGYGLSECSGFTTVYPVDPQRSYRKIPVGKPIDNTSVYVLDGSGQALPPYIPGNLFVGGACVGAGFLDNEELSATRFLTDPFRPGSRMYDTRDRAMWNGEGDLVYLGRRDRQVKIRGVGVELDEVEQLLMQYQPLGEAAVVARDSGQGLQLAAFVMVRQDQVSAEQVRRYLQERLPPQAVPQYVVFMAVLPKTTTGKIDRIALQQYDPGKDEPLQEHERPQGDTEATLVGIWKRTLNSTRVGILDNYFEIGGHSLNLMLTIAEINRRFGTDLRADDLIRNPSVRRLAAEVEKKTANSPYGAPATEVKDADWLALNISEKGLDNLVILPPFAGIVFGYRALGTRLEGKVNLYGINAKGMFDPAARLPSSVEEIAAECLQLVKDMIGCDNLYLCGYSASIPVVFEMTKLLEKEGGAIKKLFLVDDFFKAGTVSMNPEQRQQMEVSELLWGLKTFFGVDLPRSTYSARWFEEQLAQLGDDDTQLSGFTIRQIKRFKEVIINIFDCLLAYRHNGTVAADTVYFYTDHYQWDDHWSAYVRNGFECDRVYGLHSTIFLAEEIDNNSAIFLKHLLLPAPARVTQKEYYVFGPGE